MVHRTGSSREGSGPRETEAIRVAQELKPGVEHREWMHCTHSTGRGYLRKGVLSSHLGHEHHPSISHGCSRRRWQSLCPVLCPVISTACQPCCMSYSNTDTSVCPDGRKSSRSWACDPAYQMSAILPIVLMSGLCWSLCRCPVCWHERRSLVYTQTNSSLPLCRLELEAGTLKGWSLVESSWALLSVEVACTPALLVKVALRTGEDREMVPVPHCPEARFTDY